MADNFGYTALAVSDHPHHGTFYSSMKPAIWATMVFGPFKLFGSCCGGLVRISSLLLFLGMLFVACVGVFFRSVIDTWIQFALYAVPIMTYVIGANIVNSEPFLRLLNRKVSTGPWATFYVSNYTESRSNVSLSMPQNYSWVRRNSVKILLYPLWLEALQWGTYLGFFLQMHDHSFAGSKPTFEVIDDHDAWLCMYVAFWTISVYSVGVVACLFIFVSRLIMRDVISYLSLFGYSPVLKTRRSHLQYLVNETIFGKLIRIFLGIVLLDVFESSLDMFVGSSQLTVTRHSNSSSYNEQVPARTLDDLLDHEEKNDNGTSNLSQKEAAILLTQFINEFSEITAIFQPFTVILSFFAVSNLITHVCLFALRSSELIRFWTLSRTLIWLFTSVRILISVSQITYVLAKVEPHVKYLRAAGKLQGDDKEWDRFFDLTKTFRLETRAFGFPLNLRQTASLATLLNMSFLIVISVVRAHYGKI